LKNETVISSTNKKIKKCKELFLTW